MHRPGVGFSIVTPVAAGIDHAPPRLAPGIRLHGEMPGVGFTTKQWLLERNQQFLQVSELLYRVLEQIDGTRRVAEIARAVTITSEWTLEPEHVQHLISTKLQPLGLVVDSGGQVAVPQDSTTSALGAPLRLHMRMRMIPPRVVERLTDVLQYAYAPVLLIPILALIAFAHWWLYSVSGVQSGVQGSLTQPGALAAVLVLAIAAGLFHELGHSAALKYGGGKPRGIGFGLFMIFPAFYSDVTDSYRLGRAARIRTDLGGIYFHMIFAAGLIGISARTDNQFLLAAAILFNIEALRQFIPFVRLDGYWLLADLTGVPDFFSQIGSFVRSVRPNRKYARVLPHFRPWVTVAFGLYLALSIPALVYVVTRMVMYLPELAELTGQALTIQIQLWSATPEPLTRVLIALQIAFIPLPLAAAGYFLYLTFSSLGLQLGPRLTNKIHGLPLRRLAGATALGAVVLIGWAPALGLVGKSSPGGSPRDPAALVQRAQAATARLQSVEADVTGALGGETISGTLALRRPNHAHVEVHGSPDSLGSFRVVSDGAKVFVFFPDSKQYTEVKTAADGANITAFVVDQVRVFFKPERLAANDGQHLAYVGREQLGSKTYDVVEVRPAKDGTTWRYYISADDELVHRVVTTTSHEGKASTRVVHLDNVRINRTIDDEKFRWTPPFDAAPLGLEIIGGALPLKSAQH